LRSSEYLPLTFALARQNGRDLLSKSSNNNTVAKTAKEGHNNILLKFSPPSGPETALLLRRKHTDKDDLDGNMMKSSQIALTAIVCLFSCATVAACPGISVGQTSCSTGVLTGSSLSTQCSDENTIYVSGTVTAGTDFNGDATVTLLPCVWGTGGKVCFDQYKQNAGAICNLISNADGNACGTAGSYSVDQTFEIPEESQSLSSIWNMFTIKILIDDEEACQTQADSTNASAYLLVGVGSLLTVSGLYFMRRRKRPLVVLDDEDDLDGTAQHRFVEMKGYDAGRMA
jgi:LPXTG-motif cell wall-anchored protein